MGFFGKSLDKLASKLENTPPKMSRKDQKKADERIRKTLKDFNDAHQYNRCVNPKCGRDTRGQFTEYGLCGPCIPAPYEKD